MSKVKIKAGSFEHDGWLNGKAPDIEIETEKSIPSLNVNLFCGDSLKVLKTIADNSIDSVVCDPPYGLSKEPDMTEVITHWLAGDDYTHKGSGFMGKKWDSFVPGPAIWRECLRVLKPGGHLLAFFGSRTYDMGTLAIRLAGFEIRDQIMWVYGSGFPKSLDVSKAIDKAAGAEREVISEKPADGLGGNGCLNGHAEGATAKITAPSTDEAKQWEGWGTALKPAHEPICVARKPLAGTVATNVLAHGTGGLNIDGCRIGSDIVGWGGKGAGGNTWNEENNGLGKDEDARPVVGRWPANLVHDGSDEVLAAFPDAKGQQGDLKATGRPRPSSGRFGDMASPTPHKARIETSKSAARFFYCAKASKADRNYGLSGEDISSAELVGREDGSAGINNPRSGAGRTSGSKNPHPTVKPIALMEWLVKLVTPAGGIALDPFMGSGSTGIAAVKNGYRFVGIEMDEKYFQISRQRIEFAEGDKK